MDDTSTLDVSLFDEPLPDPLVSDLTPVCENETPKEKPKRQRSKSTGAKSSASKSVAITPKATKRRSKKALWSVNKALKKSSRSEISPWDRAIAKSPGLAAYVQERLKADEEIDQVTLNVVEVPTDEMPPRNNWTV